MQPDMTISWDQHLKKGNVWRVEVELSMQETPGDFHTYNVEVYVVAPTQALAQYIVATMYPDYELISVDDEPTRTAPDFPHEPPKGYHYEVESFRRNVCRICIVNDGSFSYTDVAPKSVWGFYNAKSRTYSAPINFSKQGDTVDINKTRPYTAMQLNLNPLEAALYG